MLNSDSEEHDNLTLSLKNATYILHRLSAHLSFTGLMHVMWENYKSWCEEEIYSAIVSCVYFVTIEYNFVILHINGDVGL